MEASLICQHINHALKKMLCLLSLIEQKYKVHKSLKEDIEYLDRELGLIACTIGDEQRAPSPSHHTRPTWEHLTEDLRDLGFEIEDCIDRLLYCSARVGQDNILKRAVNFLFPITLRFADDIRRLKKKTEQALEGWKNDSQPSAMDDDPSSSSSSSRSGPHILRDELEGIDAPLKEIIELLDLEEATPAEQPGKLKVISIVGSGGVGKTVLAREAFDSDIGKLFTGPRAWVSAADSDAQDVLRAILQELKVEPVDSDVSRQLRARLDHERYFIVIDDMRKELWCTLRSAFPSNSGYSSRIIVTTSIHSVAKACSSGELDHVYTMATLGDYYSKKLFSRKARCSEHNLEEIVKKCDGLPLALDSIAQFMRNWGLPQEEVCKRLGFAIDKDDTLARLRRVLHHNYTNLPGNNIKPCLLYLGMFPSGYPIRRKSLIRRWLAEGFVQAQLKLTAQDVATWNFDMLVDRNIVRPIDVSNSDKVKTCQAYGMMLEFILHRSASQRFMTTTTCQEVLKPKHIRRISIHCGGLTNWSLGSDLSFVRSLIIFGEVGQHIMNFQRCYLLRLLDLEECNDLNDTHLQHICNLLLLKYLSLGRTITTLPREIAKLQFLETLDVRRTQVNILPIEVIMLPCLIHLFGKFEHIDRVRQTAKLEKFLSQESKLQTLAGFFVNSMEGSLQIAQLLSHMKKLRKVKLWRDSTASGTDMDHFHRAIENFIRDDKQANSGFRSLSLHFDNCPEDLPDRLEAPCYLTSLKLYGQLHKLPDFVGFLHDLKELCLSVTELKAGLLSTRVALRNLLYLKLMADHIEEVENFDICFPSLLRLCLKLDRWTHLQIKMDLPQLVSLQLLCEGLDGLSGINIQCLKSVKEIILDSRVREDIKECWKNAAKQHPNRPKVEMVGAMETETGTNSQSPNQEGSSSSSSAGNKRKEHEELDNICKSPRRN